MLLTPHPLLKLKLVGILDIEDFVRVEQITKRVGAISRFFLLPHPRDHRTKQKRIDVGKLDRRKT
jgi:hypothetical protein